MFNAQTGLCAICGLPETQMSKHGIIQTLSVCRNNGQVFGLTCARCRFALVKVQHDPQILLRAANYLEK